MRASVGALSTLAPEAAAKIAADLFFRTNRSEPAKGERDVLASASTFFVPFRDERLAAWSWGSGPTVMLVHGWNGRATQLGGFVEPLLASGHRVVAFDHVGHGASTGSSTSLVDMAVAVRTVAEAAGGVRAIVGHSLGAGATVLALADGLPTDRAVLIAPPLAPDPFFARMSSALGLGEQVHALARRAAEKKVGRTFAELHLPTVARALTNPALIVHDREDREIPVEAGELLSYAWRGSRFLLTAGLGHRRILASPGVIESVKRFVAA